MSGLLITLLSRVIYFVSNFLFGAALYGSSDSLINPNTEDPTGTGVLIGVMIFTAVISYYSFRWGMKQVQPSEDEPKSFRKMGHINFIKKRGNKPLL